MGEFYDSIKGELDALRAARFGVDYDSNATVVKAAQTKINSEGYSPALATDGIYGPNTKAGIEWYQSQHGLAVDGILGPQTIGSMGIPAPAGAGPTGNMSGGSTNPSTSEFASLVSFASKYNQTITQGTGVAPGFQATRNSVVLSYVSWSKPLEGYTDYPYTDAHGLVTTGMGNLIDSELEGQQPGVNCGHGTDTPCGSPTPTAAARALPWSGSIDADWAAIKQAWPGTQSTADAGITSSRLSADAIQGLINTRMQANEKDLISGLPAFSNAPADAQLAVHSMAWAMGSGFAKTWTQFRDAFNSEDYATAAAQSHMQGVGIDMRNLANKLLLTNAASVKAKNLNRDHLYYIEGITAFSGGGILMGMRGYAGSVVQSVKAHPYRSAAIGVGGAGLITFLVKIFGGK